jgi:hypothetical protein
LLAQSDYSQPRTEEELAEERAWIDMVPVGREFGSAEVERQEEVQSSEMHDSSGKAQADSDQGKR